MLPNSESNVEDSPVIEEFSSSSCSDHISDFSQESQSILADEVLKSTRITRNSIEINNATNNEDTLVKNLAVIDNESNIETDVVELNYDENVEMDTSGASLKRKT